MIRLTMHFFLTICLYLFLLQSVAAEPYLCPVEVSRVIDGDTVVGDVSLPFDVTLRNQRFRAATFDTWEMRGPNKSRGHLARLALYELRDVAIGFYVEPVKAARDDFGRILGIWWYRDTEGQLKRVSEYMRAGGHLKDK